MKRLWIIGGVVLLAGWFGLKNVVYRSVLQAVTPSSVEPLDYTQVDSWAAYPDIRPPGAWDKPWGVDIFLIGPPSGIATGSGLVASTSEAHRETFDANITELSRAMPRGVPLYAPHYPAPSAVHAEGEYADRIAADLDTALDTYLASENRGRALLLAVDERALPYAHTVSNRLESDDIAERFAGRIVFGQSDNFGTPASCNPSLENTCEQIVSMQTQNNPFSFLFPRLPGEISRRSVTDPDGAAEAIRAQTEQVSAWLDANGPKPAEPLGNIQEVKIVPIRRPGEIDED